MRLKPTASGLRYLDILSLSLYGAGRREPWERCCAVSGFVMLFCAVFIYQYFYEVLRFFLCYSVRCLVFICAVWDVRTPLRPHLFGLLSDLKFYYMHVKVSCKGIDTEADLSVLIHRQC